MDLSSLKSQIKSGQLNNWYVFVGPEVKAMDIYIEQMAKVRKATVQRLDEASDLVKKSRSKSFVKQAHIYILRDCKDFLSSDDLKTLIAHSEAFKDAVIIFIYAQIDKRSKLYKSSKDDIVEFEPLKSNILAKYIKKQIDLSDANCSRLIEICGADYSRILLEIDKILTYKDSFNSSKSSKSSNTMSERTVNDGAFEHLVNDGTIYSPSYDAIFDFVDAVLKYKPKLAFRLLQESYDSGEATLVILSNLYNSTKQLLQYQSYKGNDIANATGLTPFQIKLASGRKGIYSCGDLVYFMKKVREAEKGIKTGEIEDAVAVPYVLVCLWG